MTPHFFIRNIPIYGDLILAPMAGYSDVPYRLLCREFDMPINYTEVISMDGILWNNQKTFRLLDFRPVERPVVFQILGNDEDKLTEACRIIEQLGPDIIDINMGCSVSDIAGKGAGAGLLKYPQKIGRIFSKLTQALKVPVTGKIRLGWDDKSRNYLEVARILEENGAALIAVHGRTRSQSFFGKADWDAIAEVKQAVKIPVIGNGDVKCVADAERMKTHTHCDGVMIGRGAVGNPWLFRRRDRDHVSPHEKFQIIQKHLARMVEYYGENTGVVNFRKHAIKYIAGMHSATDLRIKLVKCTFFQEMVDLFASYAELIQKLEAA